MNRWTIILLIGVVIVGGVVLLFVIKPTSKPATETPQTSEAAIIEDAPLDTASTVEPTTTASLFGIDEAKLRDEEQKARFTLAAGEARKWQADALLYGLEVRTNEAATLEATNEIYVFGSRRDPSNWYLVTFSNGATSMLRQLSPKTDIFGDLSVAVNFSFFKLGPYQALVVANDARGQAVRETGGLIGQTLTLAHSPPNQFLTWQVSFESLDGTSTVVSVNAATGVVESEGQT